MLAIARSEPYQLRHGGFEILLIAPPPLVEQGTYRDTLMGGAAKSDAFAGLIRDLADHWGLPFFDAGKVITSSPIDGVHFTAPDHIALGKALAEKVRSL